MTLPFLLGRVGLAVGAVAQAGVLASWWWTGWGFLLAGTVLQLMAWLVIFFVGCGEGRQQILARRHHGRYYVEADFVTDASQELFGLSLLQLMRRAQRAVNTVTESEVDAAGLLDDIANAVILPQQEWEVAQLLAELARIGRQIRQVMGEAEPSARVKEVLEPQRQALKVSAKAAKRRVAALERYAERTQAADEAYREWRAVQELEELTANMLDLLARTIRDELAIAEIDGLADKARLEQLRLSIGEARQAGLVLAAPTVTEPR